MSISICNWCEEGYSHGVYSGGADKSICKKCILGLFLTLGLSQEDVNKRAKELALEKLK